MQTEKKEVKWSWATVMSFLIIMLISAFMAQRLLQIEQSLEQLLGRETTAEQLLSDTNDEVLVLKAKLYLVVAQPNEYLKVKTGSWEQREICLTAVLASANTDKRAKEEASAFLEAFGSSGLECPVN